MSQLASANSAAVVLSTEQEAIITDLVSKVDTLLAVVGTPADPVGANTLLGQLQLIAQNTTPAP